jgi:hypothetical protein
MSFPVVSLDVKCYLSEIRAQMFKCMEIKLVGK